MVIIAFNGNLGRVVELQDLYVRRCLLRVLLRLR